MTATTEESTFFDPNVRTPEMEMAETGGVHAAADLDIADINPLNPHLFKEDRWQDHFARLRDEDPVHFNEIETAGRYWSVTKYDDVRAVDVQEEPERVFSSFVHGYTKLPVTVTRR